MEKIDYFEKCSSCLKFKVVRKSDADKFWCRKCWNNYLRGS